MTVEQWLGSENQLGIDIWKKKYQKYDETFDEWVERVSNGHAKIKQLIYERKFLPGGRIMSNIGINDDSSSLMNCYSRGFVQDDYTDIMQAAMDIGKTFKAQGGQGLSLSKLRPAGTPIGDKYTSDGIVPFMKIYNEVTEGTSQGGARKGALLISLDAWHKEAPTFVTIKSELGMIEKANISLEIDDEFMQAVQTYYETGEEVTIIKHQNYSGHEISYEVTPIKIFKSFIHNNYDWGDPGCLFVDRFRNYNIMQYDDDYCIETCNPCGEQPLPKHGACCLSSLNLSEFVINPYTEYAEFDMEAFTRAIPFCVKYLDDIVDINSSRHPLEEQRNTSKNYRNIGLGVFGYGSALMKLGYVYGSSSAIEFTDDLFNQLFRHATMASALLANERGPFPKYSDVVWESKIIKSHFTAAEIDNMRKCGLRNCSLISIAPTGSLATMLGETGGCEPEFAISYTRRTVGLTDNEDHYYKVYCKCANEYMKLHETTELPNWFVSSYDIDPFNRIVTQSVMQDHVDTAISSTINLPEDTTEELMAQLYLKGWKLGLKGLTIFRNNCKKMGILTTEPAKPVSSNVNPDIVKVHELKRGDIVKASDDLVGLKRKLTTGCGSLHCTAFFDPESGDLMETYFSKGSTGGCQNFMIGVSRTISLLARAGVSIYDIKDQLDSCGVCPSYATRSATKRDTSKGACCPTAIGNALLDMWKEFQELNKTIYDEEEVAAPKATKKEQVIKKQITNKLNACPQCGTSLDHVNGCLQCRDCGYSKCD